MTISIDQSYIAICADIGVQTRAHARYVRTLSKFIKKSSDCRQLGYLLADYSTSGERGSSQCWSYAYGNHLILESLSCNCRETLSHCEYARICNVKDIAWHGEQPHSRQREAP